MPKWIQKRAQNRGLGDQGSDFWGFGRVFEESDFWWVFDRRKVGLKSTKIATWSGQKGVWTKGRRDEAVPAEAFGVWQELAGVCRKRPERPAPRKGGGGFKGSASCRRPHLLISISWWDTLMQSVHTPITATIKQKMLKNFFKHKINEE